ncbi:MAG: DUF1712 domain-containing protein, partial [Terriglobus roseus]|nr:DUF1712 domain-containing protein [Terriglobus roseus]
RDQVAFYYSRAARARRRQQRQHGDGGAAEEAEREEENEKLRQIGLAQGMVDFAKGFADGQSVDSVDTEKQRIVLKEVEDGWWILAVWLGHVHLTRYQLAPLTEDSQLISLAYLRPSHRPPRPQTQSPPWSIPLARSRRPRSSSSSSSARTASSSCTTAGY